ncbi:hypothetical protein BN2537_8417 [Streptomyces venezuelae]|nr:hypothetical protein BN2537_8417 [Streptomyces venezuelae]
MVEHHLAKVRVASSNLVVRSGSRRPRFSGTGAFVVSALGVRGRPA